MHYPHCVCSNVQLNLSSETTFCQRKMAVEERWLLLGKWVCNMTSFEHILEKKASLTHSLKTDKLERGKSSLQDKRI